MKAAQNSYNLAPTHPLPSTNMARTRNDVKRQKVATAVEAALFNPDVVFLLAALLDARDLCQVSLTCKVLGGKQAAYNGLSLVEEASRRMIECASDWERSCLPKRGDESWIVLYHHPAHAEIQADIRPARGV